MADVSGKFFSAKKVRTGVSPSSPGVEQGETLPPVNPPGTSLNSVGLSMPSAFAVANSPLTSNGTIAVTGAGTTDQYVRGDGSLQNFPSLTGYVPYTGATADVDLGTHDLTAERGTFQNNGSSDTLTVNHTSGSGKGINVSKGGSGEALLVTKTSGSGNAMAVVGGRTALVDLSLSSVSNATGNFLTISGGVVHQRTPSETRSDVGAQAQLNGTGFVKASGTTITYDNSTYQVTSEKGQPNGYASLDGNGKVPLAQINDALIGNVNYQGLWNASTNNPTLANPPSSGTKGYYYIVSTAGTFAGISFEVGDWIISNGSAWQKVDNTDAVSSVFGRTGNVTAANGDYNTSQVTENTNLYYTEARVSANTDVAANTAARHNAVTLGTANGLSLSTQQLSLGLASAGVTGALSGTDWSTFNSKVSSQWVTSGSNIYYTTGSVLIGTVSSTGSARKLEVAGDVFIDDNTTTGNGVQLKNADRPLITRGWDAFTSGNKTGVGRWGVYMEPNELFLGAPGTDYTNGRVTLGGWLENGTKQDNLVVRNDTRRVGIGTGTPGTTLDVIGSVTATSFIRSGGTSSQFLKADGSVDSNTYYLASNPSAFIALTALSGTAPIQYNNTTGAISITQSSGSTNGFLSSTDWNTFNNKTSNVGTVTSVAALTLGTTGTDLSSSVANGTTTPVITLNVPTASAANRGALSAADWTTFNSKENAITAGTTAQYYRGDKTFQTLNTAAVPELTNLYYTEARVSANTDVAANTAARHNAVSLGTANGLSLSTQQLSLGLASSSANGALSSTDWTTFNNKQNALTNPVTGTGTAGQVSYWSSGSAITGESNLFWDATNDRLGIGTNTPQSLLHLQRNNAGTVLFRIENTAPTGFSGAHLYGSDSLIKGHFGFANSSTTGPLEDKMYFGSIANKDLVFTTNDIVRVTIVGATGQTNFGNLITVSGNIQTDGSANRYVRATGFISNQLGQLSDFGVADAGYYFVDGGGIQFVAGGANRFLLASTGAATFSSTIRSNATNGLGIGSIPGYRRIQYDNSLTLFGFLTDADQLANIEARAATFSSSVTVTSGAVTAQAGNFRLFNGYFLTAKRADGADINILGFPAASNNLTSVTPNDYNLQNTGGFNLFTVSSAGAGTFSSSVTAVAFTASNGGDFAWGDGSTYIDGDSSNQFIRAVVNNTERMRITSGGNVGIGTASPSGKLSVEATGNHITLRAPGATAGKYWALDVTTANQLYVINNAGTQYFTMTDAGNFGIGTTSPAVKLDVSGEIRSTSTSGYAALLSISALGYSILADTHVGGAMTIWTAGSEKMRVFSDGNVGINTGATNAGFKLDVNGTGRFSATWGSSSSNPFLVIERSGGAVSSAIGYDNTNTRMYFGTTTNHSLAFRTNNTDVLTLASTGAATFSSSVTIQSANTLKFNNSANSGSGEIVCPGGGSLSLRAYNQEMIALIESDHIKFSTATVERMRINSAGNVGIGTASPSTILDVFANTDIWHTFIGGSTSKLLIGGQAGSGGVVLQAGNSSTPNNAVPTTTYRLMLQRDGGNVLIGTATDTGGARRLQVAGDVFVDDNTTTGNGVQLKNADRPLITRGWDAFTSGNKTGVGRWGVYMEAAELFLGSPGTDYTNGLVTIGGWLVDGTRQPNLTVNNQTRNVLIGTTTDGANSRLTVNSNGDGNSVALVGRSLDNKSSLDFVSSNFSTFMATIDVDFSSFDFGSQIDIPLRFYTNTAERMRIFSGGNVRIGASSVTDNGNTLRVGGNTWVDGNVLMDSAANRFVGLGTGNSNAHISFTPTNDINFNGQSAALFQFTLNGVQIGRFNNAEVFGQSVRTTAPTGGSAENWKLGNAATGTVNANRLIRVEIAGVGYDLVARQII